METRQIWGNLRLYRVRQLWICLTLEMQILIALIQEPTQKCDYFEANLYPCNRSLFNDFQRTIFD